MNHLLAGQNRTFATKPLVAHMSLLMAMPLMAQSALAAEVTYQFDIPAGSLSSALTRASTTSGMRLLVPSELINGRNTKGLKGTFTLEEALQQLLSQNGLSYQINYQDKLIRVAPLGTTETQNLSPVEVRGQLSRFGDAPLESAGLKADYQTTATKMAMPLKETPQAISVVTKDSLEMRQVRNLVTAVETTPSISGNALQIYGGAPDMFGGQGITSNAFNIRGQNADVRTDGFKVASFYAGDDELDISAFERVEVVRGPSGFYGQGSLGGFINKVRKKPQIDFEADLSVQAGSYDTYRTEAGITGALNENQDLRGRLDFAYENAGSFVDHIDNERFFIAPSLEAIIDDRTRVLLQLSYQKDKFDATSGVPVNQNNGRVELFEKLSSRTELYGSTGDKSSKENMMASLTINHELSDKWLASLYLQANKQRVNFVDGNYASVYNYGYGDYVYTTRKKDINSADNWAGELRFQGSIEAFDREHQALFGLETNRRDTKREWGNHYNPVAISTVEDYDGQLSNLPSVRASDIAIEYTNDNSSINHAIFGQMLFSVTDRTKILVGTRYDIAKMDDISNYRGNTKKKDNAWTHRLGLIQTINDNMNAYAVYAESFTPTNSIGRFGPLDPETGTGYELGLKTEWFDQQLSANVAIYEQELDNRPITDPTNTRDESFSISSGLHRTRGLELEVNGSFYPGWQIGASVSWMDNEFTEPDDPNYGLSIDGSADRQFGLYTNYEFQQGSLKGLGIGATFVHISDRKFIDTDQSPFKQVYLDGYERLDLTMSYNAVPNWDINLLVRNVTDEEYINSGSLFTAYRGAPRSALLKATYNF